MRGWTREEEAGPAGSFVDIESGPHLDLLVGMSSMESWSCKGNAELMLLAQGIEGL